MTTPPDAAPGRERLLQPVPPEQRADPYPFYARLRAEDPVHRSAEGFWVLTRYDDVRAALRDPRLGREGDAAPNAAPGFRPSGAGWLEELEARAARAGEREAALGLSKLWMVNLDPPRHDAPRRAASPPLAAAAIERQRPRIRELARALVATAAGRERFDLVAELAQPLPAQVVCELVGIADAERPGALAEARALGPALAGDGSPAAVERAAEATVALARRFRSALAAPAGPPPGTLLAALAGRLPEPLAVAQAILALFAGQETTAGLIANGFLALGADPDARAALAAALSEPARLGPAPRLLSTAVEELLRFDGPVQFTLRVARAPLEIGGRRIAAGEYLALGLAAANRDPARFAAPERLDLARTPNPHLAFGFGPHACLGSALARAEAEEAFAALFAARPGLRPAAAAIVWRPGSILRAPVEIVAEG